MNAEEKLKIIQLLCASNVSYFKCAEFELRIDSNRVVQAPHIDSPKEQFQGYSQAIPNQDEAEKIKKLMDVLQMKDQEIMNTVFPDGAL